MVGGPFRYAPRWWWSPWRRRRLRRLVAELNARVREQVVDDVTAALTRQSPLMRAVAPRGPPVMSDRVVVLPSDAYKAKFNDLFGEWPRDQLGEIPHNEGVSQMGWTNFVADGVTFVREGMLYEPYPAGWELSPGVPPGDERRWRAFIRKVASDA